MRSNSKFQNGRLSTIILIIIIASFVTLSGTIFAQDDPTSEPPLEPIKEATVFGSVINGGTDEAVTKGVVRLRAFNPEFEEMVNISTTIETNGTFLFELSDINPDWFLMAGTEYGSLSFSGSAGQVSHENSSLEIPITVYDETTDSSIVTVEQQHSIVAFMSEDRLSIDEIYTIANEETAVFVGTEGDVMQGTVHFMLPAGAENVDFQRSFSAMQNSIPAMDDMIQIGDHEWADTTPARPGISPSSLVVHYELPYDGGADLSRKIPYETTHINLSLPDNGIELQGDEWTFVDSQDMGAMGRFVTYERVDTEAETAVSITIEGKPKTPASDILAGGDGIIPPPAADSNSTNLLIGGLALLLVGSGAAYFIVSSRKSNNGDEYEEYEEEDGDDDAAANVTEANALIQQLATLDTAYEAGETEEEAYQEQRAVLKEKLKEVW